MKKLLQIISANLFLLSRRSIILRRSSGSMGDNMILSFLAREIKNKYPEMKIGIETNRPELFLGNPHIEKIYSDKVAIKYYKLNYRIDKDTQINILDQLAENMPLQLDTWDRKLEIFLKKNEINDIRKVVPEKYIVIATAGKQTFASNRKEWPFEKFLELRKMLGKIDIVQIGGPDTPLLPNVVDLREIDIRSTAAVISQAATGVLLEGGFMHLANAVAKPCVIIYGGAFAPVVTGYETNITLSTKPHCSPCYTSHQPNDTCHTMECMEAISVEMVYAAVTKILSEGQEN